ncbi:MAG TPA: 6,7-dimethyl-8-ribityllumazine synthase [Phycisphaerales bacterium]|nr:6,7-dimethyl-8-ribityllumazine synthase [Phycisphaerales bacterium]
MAKRNDREPEPPRVAVVVSRYNATVTERLLDGALTAYADRVGVGAVDVITAPGAFELPALCLGAAREGAEAVVALGCLIKGETMHDRVIADAVAQGLINVTIVTGVPVTFGVLTVNSAAQAMSRSGGKEGNKGADAMNAALDVLQVSNGERAASWAGGAGLPSPVKDKLKRSPRR